MALEERPPYQPSLVGSTGDLYQVLNLEQGKNETPRSDDSFLPNSSLYKHALAPNHPAFTESNYFKSAQWYLTPFLTPSLIDFLPTGLQTAPQF